MKSMGKRICENYSIGYFGSKDRNGNVLEKNFEKFRTGMHRQDIRYEPLHEITHPDCTRIHAYSDCRNPEGIVFVTPKNVKYVNPSSMFSQTVSIREDITHILHLHDGFPYLGMVY